MCAGATGDAYHMSAQAASGVQPPAQYLNVSNIQAAAMGGSLMGTFLLTLTGTLATQVSCHSRLADLSLPAAGITVCACDCAPV